MISRKAMILRGLVLALAVTGPVAAQAAQPPSDNDISFWVKEALREDPRVPSVDLDVSTIDGIVTLTGNVDNLVERNYAVREAKKINGVRGVVDQVTVEPVFRSDSDITQTIRRRIIDDSSIHSHDLGVKVLNGQVTLDGTVDSWAEAQEAGLLARETLGVRSVENNLVAVYKTTVPDDEIRRDIVDALQRDVYLVDLPIQVSVHDGNVTLSGQVGNAYEKDRAGDDTYSILAVKSVDNELKVKGWRDEDVRNRPAAPSNQSLDKSVKMELAQDLRLAEPGKIQVTAVDGEVTLRGVVPDYYQRRVAEKDARNVAGVLWVTDLTQVSTARRDDSAILADVRFELDSDFALAPDHVKAVVQKGVVTLTGDVNSVYDKVHAEDVVSRVRGVRKIVNDIKVHWQPQYTDQTLKRHIIDRLDANWETSRVADQIKVNVKDGLATLTGNVKTWSEREEAGRLAFLTDGVWMVDNRLSVEGAPYAWNHEYYDGGNTYAYNQEPYMYYDHYYSDPEDY